MLAAQWAKGSPPCSQKLLGRLLREKSRSDEREEARFGVSLWAQHSFARENPHARIVWQGYDTSVLTTNRQDTSNSLNTHGSLGPVSIEGDRDHCERPQNHPAQAPLPEGASQAGIVARELHVKYTGESDANTRYSVKALKRRGLKIMTKILAAFLLAFTLSSTGCGNTVHFVSSTPNCKVYYCYTNLYADSDGIVRGAGTELLGVTPFDRDFGRGPIELAATDGKRILWRPPSSFKDEETVTLDLDSADARPITENDKHVLANRVGPGMSRDEVRRSWGPPTRKSRSLTNRGELELWTWDYSYFAGSQSDRRYVSRLQQASFVDGISVSSSQHDDGN